MVETPVADSKTVSRHFRANCWLVLGFLWLVLALYDGVQYVQVNRHLDRILQDLDIRGEVGESELSKVVAYVHGKRGHETTFRAGYWHPLMLILKASPREVDRLTGHCGNLSRLTVSLLDRAGARAHKIHLYRPGTTPEPYVHAVVTVDLGQGQVVVDPLFGIVYESDEGLASLQDLQRDPDLVSSQAPDRYPADIFAFEYVRGVRWMILPYGEELRSIATAVLGHGPIDAIRYPWWLERPFFTRGIFHMILGFLAVFTWTRYHTHE